MTAFSSICSGRGSWTRIPCTAGSSASFFTSASRVSCVVSAGRLMLRLSMPHWAQSLILPRTYTWLAGFSPTRMTARQGLTPWAFSAVTFSAASALVAAANALPSIILAPMIVPSFKCIFLSLRAKRCRVLHHAVSIAILRGGGVTFLPGQFFLPGSQRRVLLPGPPRLLRPVRFFAVLPALPELRLQPLHFL